MCGLPDAVARVRVSQGGRWRSTTRRYSGRRSGASLVPWASSRRTRRAPRRPAPAQHPRRQSTPPRSPAAASPGAVDAGVSSSVECIAPGSIVQGWPAALQTGLDAADTAGAALPAGASAKEEQAAKSALEECVVCFCPHQKVSMAVCNKGHAVCKTCFEGYAGEEMSNGQRQFRCPLWPADLASCTGRFSEQNVAQILPAQLYENYMRGIREQIRAEEYQKSHQVVHRIASELKARVPGISQEMLEQQLRHSLRGSPAVREVPLWSSYALCVL